jgi:hypothetical protein
MTLVIGFVLEFRLCTLVGVHGDGRWRLTNLIDQFIQRSGALGRCQIGKNIKEKNTRMH